MKKLIIPLLAILLTPAVPHVKAALNYDTGYQRTPSVASFNMPESQTTPQEPAQAPEPTKPAENPTPPAKPVFDANNPATWPTCAAGEIVRADTGLCAQAATPPPQAGVAGQIVAGGSGSCASEIAKYGWNQNVALAVARAESGLDPGNLNDNPSTGDYSVGCFQINIYGANARTRPSEGELKNAATNVAWAYKIYTSNGHSFLGQWGVCRSKVSCY